MRKSLQPPPTAWPWLDHLWPDLDLIYSPKKEMFWKHCLVNIAKIDFVIIVYPQCQHTAHKGCQCSPHLWWSKLMCFFFWNKAKHFPSHLKFQIIYYKRSPLESFSSLSRWSGAKVSQSWGEVTTFWRSKFRKCGMLKQNDVSCYRKDDTEGWIFTKMKEDHPECFLLFFWIFPRACRSD